MTRTFLALVFLAILTEFGAPRLIGFDCGNRPIAFAQEESDFVTTCAAIVPLWEN